MVILKLDKGPLLLAGSGSYSARSGTNVVQDPETNTSSETDAPKTGDDTKWSGGDGPLEAKRGLWQFSEE